MTLHCDSVWTNARLLMPAGTADGMIAATSGRIVHAGAPLPFEAAEVTDCQGRWITPGLIDPHTHLVFAGNRADEFRRRLDGETYETIAAPAGVSCRRSALPVPPPKTTWPPPPCRASTPCWPRG